MAIEKKTIIDQIEIARNGTVQVRFALQLLEDGIEISSTWHRSAVAPGVDPQLMLDAVNADIQARPALRAAPIDTDRVSLLEAVCQLAHTPEVVAKHQQTLKNENEHQDAG
jgi:hypothetical protein